MATSRIVSFWESIFRFLRDYSLFEFVRKKLLKDRQITKDMYRFVEIWVVANLMFALICVAIARIVDLPLIIGILILVYSFLRVLEVIVVQVNVLLFDQYQKPNTYEIKSYRRSIILLLHNYLEIVLWFAASYSILIHKFELLEFQGSILELIYFSFIVMVTFGSNVSDIPTFAHLIIVNQAIVGLFMTIICLARFVNLLPSPRSMDPNENESSEINELKTSIKQLEKKIDELTEKAHPKG